jgi:hypothetical protein
VPPAGYEVDPNDPAQFRPVPGSEPAYEREQQQKADKAKREREQRLGAVIVQDMDRAIKTLDEAGSSADGVMGAVQRAAVSRIPGSEWYDLKSHLDAAAATVSLQNLQELKETTGAGLGNVSDKQSALLAAAYGAIDLNQSAPTLKDNLVRLRNIYLDIIFGHGRGPERIPLSFQDEWVPEDEGWVNEDGTPVASFGNTSGNARQGGTPAPEGWEDDWEFLNDEERAEILRGR